MFGTDSFNRKVALRTLHIFLLFALSATPQLSQEHAEGPASEKAQKTYKEALEEVRMHRIDFALDSFKKADKQDGGALLGVPKEDDPLRA